MDRDSLQAAYEMDNMMWTEVCQSDDVQLAVNADSVRPSLGAVASGCARPHSR